MARIKDVTAYICARYPHKDELSKARVTKLVYLADWKSAQKNKKQITKIEWYFHNYGPYVEAVVDSALKDPRFNIVSTSTMYGDEKTIFKIKNNADFEKGLSEEERKIIDDVISDTKNLYWDSFIKHVYGTYPIRVTDRYKTLNLVALAKQESSNK
ncbi:Panacea domain-containing protein [Oceanobacter kriegii]|uniref:Panacea domain-containing protein n=1 Tax=Oceanobacter kriegii TaxID=64972 RepID=UPI0004888C9A|nr:Panacea domain-containing protein [Oceanobacter kriegii]